AAAAIVRADTSKIATSLLARHPRFSRWHFRAGLQIGDTAAILAAAAFSFLAVDGAVPSQARAASVAAVVLSFVHNCVVRALDGTRCDYGRQAATSAMKAAFAWAIAATPIMLFAVASPNLSDPRRAWIFTWAAGALALILATRLALAYVGAALMRSGRLGHTICIVGSGYEAQACAARAARLTGIVPLGFITCGDPEPGVILGVPFLGTIGDAARLLREARVDELVVAPTARSQEAVWNLVAELRCLPVKLSIWPESIMLPINWGAAAGSRSELPVLPVADVPLHGWNWVLKDLQDRALALFLTMLCAPVLVAIAIGIKLSSPGPVFFRQVREGYCGSEFRIFKFRTMHMAEEKSGTLMLTAKDDPRIFRFGSILRKTSLDELPQLLNVILGDMWLIGPRPHSPLATASGRLYAEAVLRYAARHRVKPGITGWAQVKGWRGPTVTAEQIEQRVAHDLFYIENWSPLLDLRILLLTAAHGFIHENAF
ncbi:MAG TPA: exopolysaccharide biosynthesis polyprenyl glycosylphosphotransferase, partial [Rhodopila sp.]|nr:exopolysaccharide biosynthesis polyprenyl glycosylphosphotransferase [Rhodopila sp.]